MFVVHNYHLVGTQAAKIAKTLLCWTLQVQISIRQKFRLFLKLILTPLFRKLPEENELQNNPHSLQELLGSIRREVAAIPQELRRISEIISGVATPV
jgi:hypothetical protein